MTARPDADLALAHAAHARLAAVLADLDDATARRPSRLDGWSVGHVLTHLARNADGLRNIVEHAARGEVGTMYPGGAEQRNGDIDAGAGRPAAALVADVLAASTALEAAWPALTEVQWAEAMGDAMGRPRPVRDTPFIRCREVEVHLADAGLDGFGVDDWSDGYVAGELARVPGDWPAGAEALTPRHRVAWRIGRLAVDGLGDPGPWT